jgi:predicted lipoprotein with Yx(FWY)xxD motif
VDRARDPMPDQGERDGAAHFEGLRAWLREVDRTIRNRSRIGLALAAVALAGAGVALYLGVDASRHGASVGEVQRLQSQIDALQGQVAQTATRLEAGAAAGRSRAGRTDAEVAKLQSQVQHLQKETAAAAGGGPSQGAAGPASPASGGKGPGAGANGSKGPATGAGKSSSGEGASVSTASSPKLGQIIVDSHGLALYDFHKDTGVKSACYGSCASVWPPLTTSGAPKAIGGAEASKLGTTQRSDGTTQVTYAGHPLYTYAGDMKPGEATGNGITEFGASWHALHPTGAEAGG